MRAEALARLALAQGSELVEGGEEAGLSGALGGSEKSNHHQLFALKIQPLTQLSLHVVATGGQSDENGVVGK